MIRKGYILASALAFVGVVAQSFMPGVYASTQKGLITDFSAILLSTMECTCTGATYLITLDDLTDSTLTLTYMPGVSALKLDYNFYTSGVQFLGQYTTDTGLCQMYIGYSCTTVTADGLITPSPYQGLGTSGQPVM
jgi:hypothetical protein